MIQHEGEEEMMQRGSGIAGFVSETMRKRPEALLLLAAGAALMMTSGRGQGLRESVSRAGAGGIGERLHSAADSASHLASDMRERVGDQVDELREAAGGYAHRAARRAQEQSEALTERTGAAMNRVRSGVQENIDYMLHEQPIALGALSLLAGVIIGAALPRTVLESRTLGVTREPLRGRMEAFKAAASDAGEKVKEAVSGAVSEAGKARDSIVQAASRTS
jgi:hypothetical protein